MDFYKRKQVPRTCFTSRIPYAHKIYADKTSDKEKHVHLALGKVLSKKNLTLLLTHVQVRG